LQIAFIDNILPYAGGGNKKGNQGRSYKKTALNKCNFIQGSKSVMY
jgi:hypothetical protein